MTKAVQSLRNKGSLLLLLMGTFVLAVSISSAAQSITINDTPFCEGFPCFNDSDCGSKCICNPAGVCLDNTIIQVK